MGNTLSADPSEGTEHVEADDTALVKPPAAVTAVSVHEQASGDSSAQMSSGARPPSAGGQSSLALADRIVSSPASTALRQSTGGPPATAEQTSQTVVEQSTPSQQREQSQAPPSSTADILREIETLRTENATLQSQVTHYAIYVSGLAQQLQMMQAAHAAAAWRHHQQQLLDQQQLPHGPQERHPRQQPRHQQPARQRQQQQRLPYQQQYHHHHDHYAVPASSSGVPTGSGTSSTRGNTSHSPGGSSPVTPQSSAWSSLPRAEDGRPSLELALAMANIEDQASVDRLSRDEVCLMNMEARLDAEAGWDSKNGATFGDVDSAGSESGGGDGNCEATFGRISATTAMFQRQRKANLGRDSGNMAAGKGAGAKGGKGGKGFGKKGCSKSKSKSGFERDLEASDGKGKSSFAGPGGGKGRRSRRGKGGGKA